MNTDMNRNPRYLLPGWRSVMAFGHDVLAVVLAWSAAYLARYNLSPADIPWSSLQAVLVIVVPVHILVFFGLRLYGGIWRYASLADLSRIALAILVATVASPMCFLMLRLHAVVPRSVLLLAPVFLLLLMGGSRMAYRMWRESGRAKRTLHAGEPVIVLGAGDAAVNLLKEMQLSRRWRAVAILDDDPRKKGCWVLGVQVVGTIQDFPAAAERFATRKTVLAMPSVAQEVRRDIVEFCVSHSAEMMVVPSFEELLQGGSRGELLRRIDVADLLGREPVRLDMGGLNGFLGDKVVMVTGAGGSIGSELCRQIARFRPRLLVCVDISEYALYRLDEEFSAGEIDVPRVCLVADVKNRTRIDGIVEAYRPRVLFHAAAYKHVPLMEDQNACEAIRNNALGTYTVARAAAAFGVDKFVLVSTDKAVNPTNVMGASKRLAEMLCQALAIGSQTRFEIVRFGNVLGSAGSVIPKFEAQIARGGPVTVTHPEIIRYFMSIPEAAQLVLQAGLMGQGSEIFILDMGQPVKIVDLARSMIRLAGASEQQIRIEYTGLRPGEKLYEELLADDELTTATEHPKLRIAQSRSVDPAEMAPILTWLADADHRSALEVKRELRRWVPEYSPALPRPELQVVNGNG